jgi:hypothetical protein
MAIFDSSCTETLSFIMAVDGEPKDSKKTYSSETNNRSDVWLTVHRNSVWIRKTN